MTSEMFRVLSLGAGVQSTTLFWMALRGEEPVDAIVFSDTGWEPVDVYRHLETLRVAAESAGVPFAIVSSGNIKDDLVANASGSGDRFASIPLYIINKDGSGGILRRQCTTHYKVEPIRRWLQAHRQKRRVELLMGISLDEAVRMRDSNVKYIVNRYPLIDRGMTRSDCVTWLQQNGQTVPPKSACVGCPFHDDRRWREIKQNQPEEWASAVAVDEAIRHLPRIDGETFLHRRRIPLADVDLSSEEDRGQLPMFAMECEGMCGV